MIMKLKPKAFINISDEGPEVRAEFFAEMMPKDVEWNLVYEDISDKEDYKQNHAEYFAYKITFEFEN